MLKLRLKRLVVTILAVLACAGGTIVAAPTPAHALPQCSAHKQWRGLEFWTCFNYSSQYVEGITSIRRYQGYTYSGLRAYVQLRYDGGHYLTSRECDVTAAINAGHATNCVKTWPRGAAHRWSAWGFARYVERCAGTNCDGPAYADLEGVISKTTEVFVPAI
jgi:hypothetical protein